MSECPFCAITTDEAPSNRVYADERTLAFLDHAPIADGHTLVIPKTHVSTLSAADPTTVSATFQTVRRVGRAVERTLEVSGYTVLQSNGAVAGQEVDHLHVHVVPRREGDSMTIDAAHDDLTADRGEEIAERLRATIE